MKRIDVAVALVAALFSFQSYAQTSVTPWYKGAPVSASNPLPVTGASTCSVSGVPCQSAATYPIGTSGATVPLLNGTNTWSGAQNFTSTISLSGTPFASIAGGYSAISSAYGSGYYVLLAGSASDPATYIRGNDIEFEGLAGFPAVKWQMPTSSSGTLSAVFYPNDPTNDNNQFAISIGTLPNNNGISLTMTCQNGTTASPTAVQANQECGFLQTYAYDGSAFNSGNPPALVAVATQNWTTSDHGMGWLFQSIQNGNTTANNEVSIECGLVALGGTNASPHYTQCGAGQGTISAANGYYVGDSTSGFTAIVSSAGGFTGPTIATTATGSSLTAASSSVAQAGAFCGSTSSGGTVTIDTTLSCLSSAETLKDDRQPFAGASAELERLIPITYEWKPDAPRYPNDPGQHIGLGAYATAYVDERLIARDARHNPRGWREDALIALLVAGFQEQSAEVAELKGEVSELKARR